jgi:hypothetical protein
MNLALQSYTMPENLKILLETYTSATLDSIARVHDLLPKQDKSKLAVITILEKELTQPARIQRTFNGLSPTAQAVLNAILRRDGKVTVRQLREELARLDVIDRKAQVEFSEYSRLKPDPRAANSRRLEDILTHLELYGLVFNAFSLDNPNPSLVTKYSFHDPLFSVFVPESIRRHLPKPPPLPEREEVPPRVKTTREGSARTFQRELYLYWGFIRDHTPFLTAKDELSKKALREVNALLLTRHELQSGESENDHPRLRFLRQLLIALELCILSEGRNLSVSDKPEFFALSPAERVKKTYESWLQGNCFNELLLLPKEHLPRSTSVALFPPHSDVASGRKMVIEQIRKLSPKGWLSFDRLVEQVRMMDYEFLFKRPPPNPYYYSLHPYDLSYNPMNLSFQGIFREEDGWEKIEANFIRGIVSGPLHWMGLADLGWEKGESEPATAFRLTALGLWLLKLGPPPEIPSEGGRVIVQPNLHIIALDPIQEATLVILDCFAERLSAERAVEYRLTRASVYAGQQADWDVKRIKEFLQQHTGAELPANVARTLDEWQTQHERIVIRPHVPLAHGSPKVLNVLENDRRTAQHLTSRPLPEVALLKTPQSMSKTVELLRSQEILPLITRRETVQPNSVTVTAQGEMHFTVPTPSLYLHGHLAAFADPLGKGYRITPTSVARAARAGIAAPQIIERLQIVHSGALPEELMRRIRAWAKHFGDAALEEITLMQVRDEQVLEELFSDPDVGPLLQRFNPRQSKALARVRTADLEKLRTLLSERGIETTNKLE